MSLEILRDPRVRAVEWRDLVLLRTHEIAYELFLPVPWLVLSLLLAHGRLYVPALLASFVFFLTGLRLVHNACHYALGVPRAAAEWILFLLSIVMLGSMHAVQFNHRLHHKHCLAGEDIEGMCARMPAWRALLAGPWFVLRLHMSCFS
jgi:fatty acid desaturase